jgi:hypothetical protein
VSGIRGLKPGDPVLYEHLNPRREPRDGYTVTRLARKWGYAEGPYGREVKFSLDSGYEDGGQYMPSGRILTQVMLEEESRIESARAALRQLGFDRRHGCPAYSADTLEAVVKILTEECGPPQSG